MNKNHSSYTDLKKRCMKGKSNSSNSEADPILKELITKIDNSILESNGRQDNIIIELKADRKVERRQKNK